MKKSFLTVFLVALLGAQVVIIIFLAPNSPHIAKANKIVAPIIDRISFDRTAEEIVEKAITDEPEIEEELEPTHGNTVLMDLEKEYGNLHELFGTSPSEAIPAPEPTPVPTPLPLPAVPTPPPIAPPPIVVPVPKIPTAPSPDAIANPKTQFVALAFDGSKSPYFWRTLVDYSKEREKEGQHVRFTFFVSGVYFLTDAMKTLYLPPRHAAGASDIGLGGSVNEIDERIGLLNEAFENGHEIGSHVNGHWNGSAWTYDEWKQELDAFDRLLFNAPENIGTSRDVAVAKEKVKGFRAPLLAINQNAYAALAATGYAYDTSGVAKMDAWPIKDGYGIWHFPLAYISLGGRNSLSMDYNHYLAQTNAKSTLKRGTPEWDRNYQQVYDAYMRYFENNYNGNRAPINIGHHFSLWNDGLYLEALLDFADEVCGKPHVYCGTYSELVEMLEKGELTPA